MQSGNSGGHCFCYDGHIRKFVSIELTEEGFLEVGFKLKAAIYPAMSIEDEIALSLSHNLTNDFCVPLSFWRH